MRHLAVAALLVAACGPTPTSSPGQSLSLAFHKGDVYTYSYQLTTHETVETVHEAIHETELLKFTVKSVDSDGSAEISVDVSNLVRTATVDEVTVPMQNLPNATVDLKIATDGRIVSQNVNGSAFSAGAIWAVLPGRAVKPGDSWSKDYDTNAAGRPGNSHLSTRSKYLRDESFQSTNAAVVESAITAAGDVSAPSGSPAPDGGDGSQTARVLQTSKSTVTTWIDLSAHRILKSHITAEFVVTMTSGGTAGPTSITGDATTDLLPG